MKVKLQERINTDGHQQVNLHLGCISLNSKQKTRPDIKKLHTLNRSIRNTMNKYYILFAAVFTAIAYSQGIDFPTTPAQAPIGGLGLLAAGGAALAYKKLRKK